MTVLTARTKIRAIPLFCGGAECSPACRDALLEVKAKLGCYINSIFSNSFVNLVYLEFAVNTLVTKSEVWAKCEVPHPPECRLQVYNGGGNQIYTAVATIILVTVLTSVVNY